jgi:hypothetical protein
MRADQVQVLAVRPVPPAEAFDVGLADGPAAVRALEEGFSVWVTTRGFSNLDFTT